MSNALYAFACVVVPAAWGLAMFHVFDFLERRRGRSAGDAPPHDYSI